VNGGSKPYFLQALDALKARDRRGAAALLEKELRLGNTSPRNLPSVGQLAAQIGEVELAIEAARRAVVPGQLPTLLNWWASLAAFGRSGEALDDIHRQPVSLREHPSVLHFRGTAASEFGRFEEAQDLFRKALVKAPTLTATWLSLAMIKTFVPGDPDLAQLENASENIGSAPPEVAAPLFYALGKACEDIGEIDKAFRAYSRGAATLKQGRPVDTRPFREAADSIVREYTAESLSKLTPSESTGQRTLFVTGLPRSGTTLVEQILRGHSSVTDGAEVNLLAPALIPAGGADFAGAIAYQQLSKTPDPWGDIGRDYTQLIDQYFGPEGLVVDKSLGQSLLIGLQLHAIPDSRIAWLRRSPDDVALSCFKTYFSTGLHWTTDLFAIADMIGIEDRLFEHWKSLFPERILDVPYEDLVKSPADWAERLQRHFGLPPEPGIELADKTG
jgi:tetratricopeptide (TPR) repeat protein